MFIRSTPSGLPDAFRVRGPRRPVKVIKDNTLHHLSPRHDTIRTKVMRKRIRQLRCVACGRVGTVTPGPRGELGMCECGVTVPLPTKTSWRIGRRHLVAGIGTIILNLFSNLLTSPVSRVVRSIRKPPARQLKVHASDRIAISDQAIIAGSIPSSCKLGTPGLVQATDQADHA